MVTRHRKNRRRSHRMLQSDIPPIILKYLKTGSLISRLTMMYKLNQNVYFKNLVDANIEENIEDVFNELRAIRNNVNSTIPEFVNASDDEKSFILLTNYILNLHINKVKLVKQFDKKYLSRPGSINPFRFVKSTPLIEACKMGDMTLFNIINNSVSDEHLIIKDSRGNNALHTCVKFSKNHIFIQLVKRYNRLGITNLVNDKGLNILHIAVKTSDKYMISDVLKYTDIDVNEKSSSGKTAIDYVNELERNYYTEDMTPIKNLLIFGNEYGAPIRDYVEDKY